jgi:2-polyprenyl-6-hydroxyphenyl methylase/3-demethylubiquinone-9 3-methyltransferase
VLDRAFFAGLGQFNVVYSWGVLHHTGAMWEAVENSTELVASSGQLFVAIYNDAGVRSRAWTKMKKLYNESSPAERRALVEIADLYFSQRALLTRAYARLSGTPYNGARRGMDRRCDLVDWVGGWPYEVAKPEEVFHFVRDRGFVLERLATSRGIGCNEFVFSRVA